MAAIPTMSHLDADARQGLTERVTADFAEPMRAWVVDGELHFPMQAHLARAYRAG